MIVLDADSVMSGETIVELVRRMEQDAEIGILQSPPVPVNRRLAVRPLPAVRFGGVWPDLSGGLRLVGRKRGELLGAQRDHSPRCVYQGLRPAETAGRRDRWVAKSSATTSSRRP